MDNCNAPWTKDWRSCRTILPDLPEKEKEKTKTKEKKNARSTRQPSRDKNCIYWSKTRQTATDLRADTHIELLVSSVLSVYSYGNPGLQRTPTPGAVNRKRLSNDIDSGEPDRYINIYILEHTCIYIYIYMCVLRLSVWVYISLYMAFLEQLI